MDFREELNNLVFIVKRNSKRKNGKALTNEEIAGKLDITRTYLSDMLSGAKPVAEKNIIVFKEKLKEFLVIVTPEMAMLNVLMDELATYMTKGKSQVSKDELISTWKKKANQELNG